MVTTLFNNNNYAIALQHLLSNWTHAGSSENAFYNVVLEDFAEALTGDWLSSYLKAPAAQEIRSQRRLYDNAFNLSSDGDKTQNCTYTMQSVKFLCCHCKSTTIIFITVTLSFAHCDQESFISAHNMLLLSEISVFQYFYGG